MYSSPLSVSVTGRSSNCFVLCTLTTCLPDLSERLFFEILKDTNADSEQEIAEAGSRLVLSVHLVSICTSSCSRAGEGNVQHSQYFVYWHAVAD